MIDYKDVTISDEDDGIADEINDELTEMRA